MMNRALLFVGLAFISMTGCASKLVVHNVSKNSNEIKGIRVRAPVSYIVTKQIETEKCPPRTEESIIHLPVGEPYDITFDPAPFGKAEFSISFTDTGALKQVTLNSDPQVAETISALAELTEKVAGAVPLVALVDCGNVTKTSIISVRRLSLTE